ncbi:MAG TPA: hypothetical protein VK559_11290 [Ferruginibacter sp.]|nr:hypothetical protein [Ferruginibacter sp.]
MKKFINKLLGILVISSLVVIVITYVICYNESDRLLFLSNSVSYNAKAAQASRSSKFKNAKLLLIGSSMTLNNISAELLADSLKIPTYNYSAWGMKLDELADIVQEQNEYIYTNISFPDLQKDEIIKKYGYPISQNKGLLELNMLTDFSTFSGQVNELKKYTGKGSYLEYTNLKFDSSGSALLQKDHFHINAKRWNEKPITFSTEDEGRFIASIEKIRDRNKKIIIIISFSPSRSIFYNKSNTAKIDLFFSRIKEKYKNIYCLDHYDLAYSDSLFVDNSHFNDQGAILYSRVIAKDIITLLPEKILKQ